MLELSLITKFYGDKRAERSGLPLINHIHEGLAVLGALGASEFSERAFCLHPMFQADTDLSENALLMMELDPFVVMLTMEYRNQANAWLSDRVEDHGTYSHSGDTPKLVVADYRCVDKPTPGPLPEVRDMLIADKVQNYKDFVEYHYGVHERSKELELYFETWLQVLGVSSKDYISLCGVIDIDKQRRGM